MRLCGFCPCIAIKDVKSSFDAIAVEDLAHKVSNGEPFKLEKPFSKAILNILWLFLRVIQTESAIRS